MKRAYSGHLNSMFVAKPRTFIQSFDELYEKLDNIKPYAISTRQAFLKLKSLNDTKMEKIFSITNPCSFLNSFLWTRKILNDILEGKVIFIGATKENELRMKLYPEIDLKLVELKAKDINLEIIAMRFAISKNSPKLGKIYPM